MKIHVLNHWLKKLGGSETFTYTLIQELKRRGFEVRYYTTQKGIVSNAIEALGVPFIDLPSCSLKAPVFDLILASHYTMVEAAAVYARGPIIQTVHGTTPKLEAPSPLASCFVAISEEVKRQLAAKGFKSEVIYNGVDCSRFYPIRPLNDKVKRVFSLCHSEVLNNMLESIFRKHGIEFVFHNKYKNPVWPIEDEINKSDMVISLGRGAYEAMACGRPVLVMDQRPYGTLAIDGMITKNNFFYLMQCNCSGRFFKLTDVEYEVAKALMIYSPELGKDMRELALLHLNVKNKSLKYLDIWKTLT